MLAGYDGAGSTGVSSWDSATGWGARAAVPGAGLLSAPYAVVADDGDAALVSGDGSIQRHVLSTPPPEQALVATIVPLPVADPAVIVQWDHELHVVYDSGAGWTELLLGTGPSDECSRPPYYPGDVCHRDEGYLAPIATWAEGTDAALVYGRYTRTGERTAVYMPGPGDGYYTWSDPPPWSGTVEHVVFDPTAGTLSTPTVLLDGVVATAGQAVTDGGGMVQLVMKDHECRAYEPWATRIATIDPAAL